MGLARDEVREAGGDLSGALDEAGVGATMGVGGGGVEEGSATCDGLPEASAFGLGVFVSGVEAGGGTRELGGRGSCNEGGKRRSDEKLECSGHSV